MARPASFHLHAAMGSKGAVAGSSRAALDAQFNASMGAILNNLDEWVGFMKDVTPEVMEDVLAPTFAKAVERCPVESGELRASGYLESRRTSEGADIEMGFGRGGLPDYAVFVHEMPNWHEPPTRDKFLQSAVDEDFFTIVATIPQRIKEVAGT